MQRSKFKPGDRVVNTSPCSKYEGIGGTVIQTNKVMGTWQLVIILDTAEYLIVKQSHVWELEQDYLDGSYIPF